MKNWLSRQMKQFVLGSNGRAVRKQTLPQAQRRRMLVLDQLEDRLTPSTLSLTSGNLQYLATSSETNNLTESYSGATHKYTFTDTGATITSSISGETGSGSHTVTVPDTGVTSISINLSANTNNDTANIDSINAAATVTTGGGINTVNVSSNAPTNTGNLAGIAAALTVTSTNSGSDKLVMSNFSASTGDSNVVVGASTITGFAPNIITYNTASSGSFMLVRLIGSNSPSLAEKFTVNDPNASTFQLDSNAGPDTAIIEGTNSSTTNNINMGAGAATVTVSSDGTATGSLTNILGTLNINEGSGSGKTLNLIDYGGSGGKSVTVSGTAVTGFAAATINYKAVGGTFSNITLSGSNTGSDTFTVTANNPALNLVANGGGDTFILQNNATVKSVAGGSGTDTLTYGSGYTNAVSVTLASSTASGFTSSSATGVSSGFTGIDTLDGTGSSTLTGESAASTWTVNAIGSNSTYNDSSHNLTFSGFSTLDGGTGGNTFNLGAGASGYSINGNTGSDTLTGVSNAVLASSTGSGFSGTAASSIAFTAIDVLDGTGSLTGESTPSTWSVAGTGGTYNDGVHTLTFGGFGTLQAGETGAGTGDTFTLTANATVNLDGGPGNDSFTVSTYTLTGSISGGAGTDSLAVSSNVTLSTSTSNGYSGTSTLISGGFTGIDSLTDDPGHTLTGENAASTWSVAGTGGSYNDGLGHGSLAFSGFGTLQAGETGAGTGDAFNVTANATVNLDGGPGNDNFTIAAGKTLTGSISTGNGTNSVTINTGASVTGTVVGGTGADTLTVGGNVTLNGSTSSGYSGANANIDGGASSGFTSIDVLDGDGSSTLFGENVASHWTINGLSASNTYDDSNSNGPLELTFSGFNSVVGGATAADTFNVFGLLGSIDGGVTSPGPDIYKVASATVTGAGTHHGIKGTDGYGNSFDDIDTLITTNTVTGSGDWAYNTSAFPNEWELNGTAVGNPATLQGIGPNENLFDILGTTTTTTIKAGGTTAGGIPIVTISNGDTLTGSIDGQDGTAELNYNGGGWTGQATAWTTPVNVTLSSSTSGDGFQGTATGISGGFNGVNAIIGSASSTGTLTGENAPSTWSVAGTGGTYNDGSHTLTFSDFATLQAGETAAGTGDTFTLTGNATANLDGGPGNDSFTVSTHTLTGSISGGAGTDTLAVSSNVSLTGSTSTGFSGTSAFISGGFAGIDNLVDDPGHTLTGESTPSTWTVSATPSYSDGSHSLTFSGFGTLHAGETAAGTGDAFNVSVGGYTIDGNAGTDTLTFTAAYGNVNATLSGSSANGYNGSESVSGTSFNAIDKLFADPSNINSLTGENASTTPNWDLAATQTYDDGSGADATALVLGNFQTLNGGNVGDTFNVTVTAAGVPLTLNGNGGGGDTFNVGFNGTTDPLDGNLTGSLANVQGSFTINGAGATLNVSDAADTSAVAWTFTASDIQSGSAGDIIYNGPSTINAILGLPTGANRNAIDVESLVSGTSFVLMSQGNSDIQLAQVGQDTSALSGASIFLAGTSSDTLTVNDQADSGNNSYTVSDSNVTTGSISVTITSPFGQLIVYGGSGTNTFDVTPSTDTTISVDGGSGSSNTLNYHKQSGEVLDTSSGYSVVDTGTHHYQTVYYYDFATLGIV